MATSSAPYYTELIKSARLIEQDGDVLKAAELYEEAIKQKPLEEFPFTRLMVIYRKLQQPKDELRVINKGLAVFKDFYEKRNQQFSGTDKLGQLSKALLKTITGSSKQQSFTHYPEPIPKWTIRKKAVDKKLAARK